MYEVIIPKVGMGITEVELVEWHVQVGDAVSAGDPLVSIDAEKTVQDLLAEVSGRIVEILCANEEKVEIGRVICRIQPV